MSYTKKFFKFINHKGVSIGVNTVGYWIGAWKIDGVTKDEDALQYAINVHDTFITYFNRVKNDVIDFSQTEYYAKIANSLNEKQLQDFRIQHNKTHFQNLLFAKGVTMQDKLQFVIPMIYIRGKATDDNVMMRKAVSAWYSIFRYRNKA